MRSLHSPAALLLAPLVLAPAPRAAAQEAEPAPAERVRLEFRIDPAIDLYYELRARAAAGTGAPAGLGERDELLEPALEPFRALDRELGSTLAWGPVDGLLDGCRSLSDVAARFAELPERFEVRRPGGAPAEIALRERALALASAMASIEPQFEEARWPARRERLAAAADSLRESFGGERGRALYAKLFEALGLQLDSASVPVHLVLHGPPPGAVTYRRLGGGGACFVGVDELAGSLLDEVVLHESVHALDLASADQQTPTLLQELRRALTDAGIGITDRRARDVPHSLFFVFAGELVRRYLDPDHVDYGERADLYRRLAAPVRVERDLVPLYLDGSIERDELVGRIAAAAASG